MIPNSSGSTPTRRPLLLFFTLAFSLSWLCWAPLVLARFGLISFQPSRYLHLLGSFGPALAALIAARICGGRTQQRDLLRRAFAWRVPLRWHLLVWLGPLLLFVTAALIVRLSGGEIWDWRTTGTSLEYPELPVLAYWAASLVFYGWGEETGWRGFALPYLQQRRSALAATIWLSVLWALWHLLLFAFAAGLSRMGLAEIAGWCFSILTGAVLFTWLMNSTGGSVLIAAVFHGTMDVVFVSPALAILSNVLLVLGKEISKDGAEPFPFRRGKMRPMAHEVFVDMATPSLPIAPKAARRRSRCLCWAISRPGRWAAANSTWPARAIAVRTAFTSPASSKFSRSFRILILAVNSQPSSSSVGELRCAS